MELILYHTSGCHLCEKARDLLWPLLSSGLQLTEIDIGDSDSLIERYGIRIPVVVYQGQELGWPFDLVSLQRLLTASQ